MGVGDEQRGILKASEDFFVSLGEESNFSG